MVDPKKRYDNSGEVFENDVAELYNIPEPDPEPIDPDKEDEENE